MLETNNLELGTKILSYEQIICGNEDVHIIIEEKSSMIELLQREKEKIEVALENALKKLEIIEKKNIELNKVLEVAFQTIKVKNEESSILGDYLKKLQEKSYIYYPVKTDEVDMKLAEELNTLPDPKRFGEFFIRIGPGVYSFRNTKYYMKVEQGKILSKLLIIIVRVGGGYIDLQDFIETYGSPLIQSNTVK